MSVCIIDYGMGNLLSVKRAFEKCGADVKIAKKPEELYLATHIILPGVGAFADGINNLKVGKWDKVLDEIVKEKKIPILGICLGMQLFATYGYESGEVEGLNYIEGEVVKLEAKEIFERVPHVGWNDIRKINNNELLEGIEDNTDFYFVHSYKYVTKNEEDIVCKTNYCGEFTSVINKDNIWGVQFHPEKSQKSGFKLIKNFLNL